MGFFSRFPYTDFHRLNADWILEKIKDMLHLTQEAAETVESYEDRLTAVETAAAGAVRFNTPQDIPNTMKRQARDNIGAAAAADLSTLSETVWGISSTVDRCVRTDISQPFTSSEQAQARSNIGAASQTDLNDSVEALEDLIDLTSRQVRNCVRFDMAQSLTDAQQAQARDNIGAASGADLDDVADIAAGAVRYDTSQGLTDAEKAAARANIGAAAEGSAPAPAGAVLYDQSQSLTAAQQQQARSNIDALGTHGPVITDGLEIDTQTTATTVADAVQIFPVSVSGQSILKLAGDLGDTNVLVTGVADPVDPHDAVSLGFFNSYTPPVPVAADAGRVLVANNNGTSTWQDQQIKIFHGTVNTSTMEVTLDSDVTYANIAAALTAGQIVMLQLTTQAGYLQIYDLGVFTTSTAIFNTFSLVTGSGGSYTLYVLTVSVTASSVTYRQSTIQF